ncbi:uncharacterized protein LOC143041634 [Oratosquilla oratoria]|uniref:uncharacterized protein LOC143041634 n=1 Tax=Oratosquilla oratoria TaxID=337810 RepID=UPI003F75D380
MIRLFHRKLLKFNASLREINDFKYCDAVFDELEVFDGEIKDEDSEAFAKHYFAGYFSFTKNGGKADHRNYQKDLVKLELTENVRLDANDDEYRRFAEKLLEIGAGDSGKIGVVVKTREELVERVYDNFEGNHVNVSYFGKRAIISPTNDDVQEINRMVYAKSNGWETLYISEGTAVNEDGMNIQTSVCNAMTSPSLPLHVLKLKIGSIVMVIRNIRPPKLCNGTRIMVTNLQKNIIVGKILSGVYREQVLLPLESTNTPVHFKRKQFPVKLSYAMTINKSQGQTFQRCGLLLDTAQCFAHGQLYMACSRVTNWNSLIIPMVDENEVNIIFR